MDKIYHDGQKSLNITLNFKLCDYNFMNIDNITFYVLQIFSDTFAQFTTLIIYFLSGIFFSSIGKNNVFFIFKYHFP